MEDTIEILAGNNLSTEDAGRTSSATRVADIMSTNLITLSLIIPSATATKRFKPRWKIIRATHVEHLFDL